jgi:ArsR family transcriptional regulator, arsenate/arsenite/antimonite-responsive transcriptional repressor
MITTKQAALGFAAVGSEPRLEVLMLLVRTGPGGLTVGQIQQRLNSPASTLAHHLKLLASAGLIKQEKTGRMIVNSAAYESVEVLADFLLHECCSEAQSEDGS